MTNQEQVSGEAVKDLVGMVIHRFDSFEQSRSEGVST